MIPTGFNLIQILGVARPGDYGQSRNLRKFCLLPGTMARGSILDQKTFAILSNNIIKKWDHSRQENVCLVSIPIDPAFGIPIPFKQHTSRLWNALETSTFRLLTLLSMEMICYDLLLREVVRISAPFFHDNEDAWLFVGLIDWSSQSIIIVTITINRL